MYGYVSINKSALSEDELNRFRAYYCGLCRALKNRCGQASRLTLSYDMTVMYLLHSALYEPPCEQGQERCAAHMAKPHAYIYDECADYAADMSLILAWYKAADDWQDEKRLDKLALRKSLQPAYEQVQARWPHKCRVIDEAVRENTQLEKAESLDADAAANVTGRIMGEIYAMKDDLWKPILTRMGHSLGRFIYLMDAYDDLAGDKKAGRPNPFSGMSEQPNFDAEVEEILTLEMADACAQFERLPIVRDVDLLRNIYYSGVWCQFARIKKNANPDESHGKETQP